MGVMGGPLKKGHAFRAAQDDDESSNLSLGTTIEAGMMWDSRSLLKLEDLP